MNRVVSHAGAIVFFLVAAIAMTWPLAWNLSTAAAHPGDPYLTSWILDWGYYALTHDPSQLFHANIFHPLRYTFAFSENTLGILLVLFPLFIAKVPLMTIHNIAILAGFASAGYAAALLGRYLTGSMAAAVIGGIFFAFVPWRFSHLTHLQHEWTLWLPLLILAILRLRDRPSTSRAILLTLCFVMNGLTNLHWLAFGSVAAVVCIAVASFRSVDRRRFLTLSVVTLVTGAILLTPILYPYWRAGQIYNMRGDIGETTYYSAHPSDWRIASLHNRLYGPRLNDGTVDPEHWSFPGIIAPLLALIGFVVALRRSRIAAAIGILLIALGFLGSLGLHTPFGRFFFDYVPLFRGIRVPARWAMIVYLGIAILASFGALGLARRRFVHALLAIALLIELRAAPIRWYLGTGETPAVYTWLARQKLNGAVLELPMDQTSVYPYVHWSHVHHKPLINGVSGFKPPDYAALEKESLQTPIPPSFFDHVRARNGALFIVHGDRFSEWIQREMQNGRLVHVATFGDDVVYATPDAAKTLTRPAPMQPAITGTLDHPVHWESITGPMEVSGSIAGPHPVRRVILHFDNHREHFDAEIRGNRFVRLFPERPASVDADTDLQVEILDARGDRKRLPQIWLRWRRPGERLNEMPLPQAADLGPYVPHPGHKDGLTRPRMN